MYFLVLLSVKLSQDKDKYAEDHIKYLMWCISVGIFSVFMLVTVLDIPTLHVYVADDPVSFTPGFAEIHTFTPSNYLGLWHLHIHCISDYSLDVIVYNLPFNYYSQDLARAPFHHALYTAANIYFLIPYWEDGYSYGDSYGNIVLYIIHFVFNDLFTYFDGLWDQNQNIEMDVVLRQGIAPRLNMLSKMDAILEYLNGNHVRNQAIYTRWAMYEGSIH